MKFYIARLSFFPSAQQPLFRKQFEGSPIELAEELLVSNTQYIPERKRGFVGLFFGGFRFGDDGRLLAVKLGKAKEIKIQKYDRQTKDFLEEKDTSYPFVYMLWDRDEQVILLEKKTTVFPKYENVLRSIEDHLNRLLMDYGLSVSIVPIVEKRNFWKYIYTYKFIYEICFKLYVPNLFGYTQKDLKELLESYKDKYNTMEILTQISNKNGHLRVVENDPEINRNLEWIEKGGGEWYITGKKSEKTKKVKIKSTQDAKTTTTEVEFENYTAEEVKTIIESLRGEYSLKLQ